MITAGKPSNTIQRSTKVTEPHIRQILEWKEKTTETTLLQITKIYFCFLIRENYLDYITILLGSYFFGGSLAHSNKQK